MSNIYFLIIIVTSIFTSAICHSKCKEYIILIKEITCSTNGPLGNTTTVREPITLNDLYWNNGYCSDDSTNLLSYDNKYSNKSYLLTFDYVDLDPICIPIIKSTKLLDHITIDDENTTIDDKEIDKDKHKINETVIENDEARISLLECLIKNYTQMCDKKESNQTLNVEINKEIDINLIHINENTNNTEYKYNDTEASFFFEQCVFTEHLCNNSETIDEYTENINMSQITITPNSNNTNNLNCTNIISNRKNISISDMKALTYSILTKYACQNESVDNLNDTKTTYNVSVYIPMDLKVLNTTMQHINCSENIKSENSTALRINCNIKDIVEIHKKENYTTASNSSTDTSLFKENFNHSIIYHCKLNRNITINESYPNTVEISNTYNVFDFRNCTADKNNGKKDDLDGSKVLIISSEVNKDNVTDLEDFGDVIENERIILHFTPNNVSDCSKIMPLNITQGRIINLRPNDEEELVDAELNSTLYKLMITNCDNYNTKTLHNDSSLELDIIFMDTNNATLNKSAANNFNTTLFNSTKRPILKCTSSLDNDTNLVMACTFVEIDNETITMTTESSTLTSSINLNGIKNDSKVSSTTHTSSTTEKSKKNNLGSGDKVKLRTGKTLFKEDITTESTAGHAAIQRNTTEDNSIERDMYYFSPRVIATAVGAILAVISSVLLYAYCLFRKKKKEYEVAPTRDWSNMDEAEF